MAFMQCQRPNFVLYLELGIKIVLTAYFDESGTDKSRSTVLTVAGYISTVGKWERFGIEWQELLQSQCIEYFHMTDIENLQKQFSPKRGWDEERKIRVLQRAHQIINDNVLKDFESSLVWSDYDEIIKSYRKKDPPSAYAVLVNACLSQVGKWADEQGHDDLISYVFEKGVKGTGWVLESYRNAIKNPATVETFRLGGISYKNKRDVIQLQAADINAYESWKQMVNRVVNGRMHRQRISLASLRRKDEYIHSRHFNKEGLLAYIASIEKEDI